MLIAERPLTSFIWKPDALSWIVGFLAGIAGMLALTSAKSGALVGVLISVTTIPAAANAAVAIAYWVPREAIGSVIQLVINLSAIAVAGTLTLLVLRAGPSNSPGGAQRAHSLMRVGLRPVGDLQCPTTIDRRRNYSSRPPPTTRMITTSPVCGVQRSRTNEMTNMINNNKMPSVTQCVESLTMTFMPMTDDSEVMGSVIAAITASRPMGQEKILRMGPAVLDRELSKRLERLEHEDRRRSCAGNGQPP